MAKNNASKTVLIAPLSWGLGHAARCIPIIRALQNAGHRVVLASDSEALYLLQNEFSNLKIIPLPAYNIRYKWANMPLNIALQLPRIIYTIVAERIAIQSIIKKENIDIILSDNRYGCYHNSKKSIFIGHQINIKTNNRYLDALVGALHRGYLNLFFAETWIPDAASEAESLAGTLSHGLLPKKSRYIGILSRLRGDNRNITTKNTTSSQILIVLSGPEPQRTAFEQILLSQIDSYTTKNTETQFILVRGTPKTAEISYRNLNFTIIPFATATELEVLMRNSDVLISRSGYTTLMDLAVSPQKAILVPTPSQTEQIYLAQRLTDAGVYYSVAQAQFDLATALRESENFSNKINYRADVDLLRQAINSLNG